MTSEPAAPLPKKNVGLIVLWAIGALGFVALLATLGSIARRNFINHRAGSKPAEAMYTLKTILTNEEAFRGAEGTWALSPRQLVEYSNSNPRSYTCFLGPAGQWGGKGDVTFPQLPASVKTRLETNSPTASDFVVACAANLDDDPLLDVWSLSAKDPIPRHDQDDSNPGG